MSRRDPWRAREWHNTTADDLEVEIVVRERQPTEGLTRLERRLVTRELTARNVAAEQIAEIVCVDPRTVYRWRAQDREAA